MLHANHNEIKANCMSITKNIPVNSLARSAYHETGHLISALLFNIQFERKDIIAQIPIKGDPVTYIRKIPYENMTLVNNCIYYIMTLSGKRSEKIFIGDIKYDGLISDNSEKLELNKYLNSKEKYKIRRICRNVCDKIMYEFEDEIRSISKILESKLIISLIEAEKIFKIARTKKRNFKKELEYKLRKYILT